MTRAIATAVFLVLSGFAAAHAQDPDTEAMLGHRLTIDLVKRTVAVDRALLALVDRDPSLVRRLDDKQARGLDATAKAMESLTEIADVFKVNGITARDYMLTQMTMISTTILYESIGRREGALPPMPAQNLEFWKANIAALAPLEAEWKQIRAELRKRAERREQTLAPSGAIAYRRHDAVSTLACSGVRRVCRHVRIMRG